MESNLRIFRLLMFGNYIAALDSASEYVNIDSTVNIGTGHGGNLSVHLATGLLLNAEII